LPYLVGVDIGGTFTDLIAVGPDRFLREAKVPTTDRPADGIMRGLQQLGIPLTETERFAHGTTIATNALVQKTGARTAIVTTAGFRDQLEIRRTNKGDLYDLSWRPPRPIVERANRLEVRERVLATGEILERPNPDDVERIARMLGKRGIESVAIVFLHSYVNDVHERDVKTALAAALPHVFIATSSEVLQEYREFERTSTTAANAYVAPVVARYLTELKQEIETQGFVEEILVMQSNGGLASFRTAQEVPARTIASGPAAGAIAMSHLAELTGFENLVGLDIGGTTADVSLVWQKRPRWANRTTVEFGLPVLFPAIDIVSIGAGGGTTAWIDAAGKLRMGPMSAGARPGPACYGAGGNEPTSTDAQLVLGRLGPHNFLGGGMTIYPDLAAEAIQNRIAAPLGLDLMEAAHGMVRIMTDNMMRATRFVSVERGYDPREFALCAFGGGGPMYAAEIARELHIPRVLVPPMPGVLSAYGMLAADMIEDASRSVLEHEDTVAVESFERTFNELEERVRAPYLRDGVPRSEVELQRHADLVYAGQTHAISIPLPPDSTFDEPVLRRTIAAFHREHLRRFRHADETAKVEFVHLRVFGRRRLAKPDVPTLPTGAAAGDSLPESPRLVYFEETGGVVSTPVYQRAALASGSTIVGPAIVEQMDSTTVVFPGMTADTDEVGNLIINVKPSGPLKGRVR
jgi:N-methylhydantoinase A